MSHASTSSIVKQRQDPLRARYRSVAADAQITDSARTVADVAADPFHGTVVPGDGHGNRWRFGIHRAVGGYHDLPNPGDVLCAALASCLDFTIRIIADLSVSLDPGCLHECLVSVDFLLDMRRELSGRHDHRLEA